MATNNDNGDDDLIEMMDRMLGKPAPKASPREPSAAEIKAEARQRREQQKAKASRNGDHNGQGAPASSPLTSSNPRIDLNEIVHKFGDPAYENQKGGLSRLNDNFWAACYAASREKIIFEPCEKEFYDFDGKLGFYAIKSADRIRTELSALVLDGAREWESWYGINAFRNAKDLAGSITHLRGQVEERDYFEQQPYCVHLGNCTLRFKRDGSSFTKEDFSPDHRNRNRSPINYDPKATCPLFKKMILSHLEKDDQLLLQKYGGQCLLGHNPSQRLLILDGVGAASKGAFVLIINGIIGQRNVYELRTKLLEERFEIGRMIGRTLLVGSDVPGNFMSSPSAYRLKALVGGDTLEAEPKNSNERFTIHGNFNVIITSNTRLTLRLDNDQGAWKRRLGIVRYEKPFKGQRMFDVDKYLLKEEASGILNWLIDGLSMFYADHAKTGDIVLSDRQEKRVADLLAESDSLRLFVENEIIEDHNKLSNGERYSLSQMETQCLDLSL